MEEYEYSFIVKDIKPYIEYCEKNGYAKTAEVKQNRVVYQNKYSDKIIARITTEWDNGKVSTVLDSKSIDIADNDLKVSQESKEIVVTSDNKDAIISMLETMGFYVSANNTRNRLVFEKDNIKFEIDDYTEPVMKVVAIEGEREAVNAVYSVVKDLEK